MRKHNIGSSFDSWLREEGIYQMEAAEMAGRMHTSRACPVTGRIAAWRENRWSRFALD
jgi:hypothetical protein